VTVYYYETESTSFQVFINFVLHASLSAMEIGDVASGKDKKRTRILNLVIVALIAINFVLFVIWLSSGSSASQVGGSAVGTGIFRLGSRPGHYLL
jgi:hypothetical protein